MNEGVYKFADCGVDDGCDCKKFIARNVKGKEPMHIIKIDADDGFYATSWCGEKVGMLDRVYPSIDNALKALEHKVGAFPCQQCLRVVIESAQHGVERTVLQQGDSSLRLS